MRTFLIRLVLLAAILAAPLMAADKFALSVDTTKAGAKIDRNLFGQFAEHLGHGVYEGIWVGPDSDDPQHPRHSQRRRHRFESSKSAERSLARRLFRG